MSNCIICNKELQKRQVKYCSGNCKVKGHYNHLKIQQNSTYSQFKRGYIRKLALIMLRGGCCQKCGYSENVAALEFHHHGEKSIKLDSRVLSNSKWINILKEFENCTVLCANCHREHHNSDLTITNMLNQYGEDATKLLEKGL